MSYVVVKPDDSEAIEREKKKLHDFEGRHTCIVALVHAMMMCLAQINEYRIRILETHMIHYVHILSLF